MQRSLSLLYIGTCTGMAVLFGIMLHRHSHVATTLLPVTAKTTLSHAPITAEAYGRLPLSFERNQGQADKQVAFLSHGPGYNLFLTPNQAVISLHHPESHPALAGRRSLNSKLLAHRRVSKRQTDQNKETTSVLRLKLLGANAHPHVIGLDELPGNVNYFIGNDPKKWRTHVPTYSQVSYKQVYPGIDMVYYGNQKQLEYDWVVAPGADVHQIQWEVTGAESMRLTVQGDLKLQTACGDIVEHAPVIYQEVDGVRKSVPGRLVLQDAQKGEQQSRIGFEVADYDHTCPLVIDPVLVYSTYLGGSTGDQGNGIAVDSFGNAYITGETSSVDFPMETAYQSSNHSGENVIVSALNASGTALIYSTYLGGSGSDEGNGIALNSSGNAYLTGSTSSHDFPTMNPYQSTNQSFNNTNAFVTKLNSTGSALVYSTYLGGSGEVYGDFGNGIAVDSFGNAYVTGETASDDFPTKNPYQATNHSTLNNAFVTKFNSTGSALEYSTYLGGSVAESGGNFGNGIAIDSSGNAYVTGETSSTDFPTKNPYQPTNHSNGGSNAFVTRFNATGSALIYSTYLGGSGGNQGDEGHGIAVDTSGNAYVTGNTWSTDFPTQNPFQSTHNHPGLPNAFVTKFNSTGSALVYSTYLAGTGGAEGFGIAVDSSGNAYVIGVAAADFPTQNPLQSTNQAGSGANAFVTKFNSTGSGLIYSTYLGGSGGAFGNGIAINSSGNAYATGSALSNFPTQNPFQATNHTVANPNAFIARIGNYNWQTVDVTVGVDNLTRLLWINTNQTVGLWTLNTDGQASDLTNIGPYTNTTAQATAAGADGLTRLLWNDTAGEAGLQLLNAENTEEADFIFGPYAGTTAVDVAIGSDNKTRLLWTNSSGQVAVWSVNNSGVVSNIANYGPYPGWTASRIAAGSDGYTRLLWNKNDGTVAVWLLNANNSYKSGFSFGPYTSWRGINIAVGSDNKTRLLWTKSDGTAGVWTVDNYGMTTNLTSFGPYTSWTATKVAAGSDGLSRLLWFKGDGTQAFWLLNSNNTYNNGFNFGPF